MKHAPIASAEIRLNQARRLGERAGRLLYHCPCAARLIVRHGMKDYEILAFRECFGAVKRARRELVLMECSHRRLSECVAVARCEIHQGRQQ